MLGLVAYLAVFATALSSRVEAAAIGAAIVLAGLAFGVYLIVIQVAVIDAICQWCLTSDAILAVLAVALRRAAATAAGRPHGGPRRHRWRASRYAAHTRAHGQEVLRFDRGDRQQRGVPAGLVRVLGDGRRSRRGRLRDRAARPRPLERELAHYLLDLRRALERARDAGAAERARRELTLLAPPDLSGA